MNILYHHRTQGTGAEGVHISQIIKGLRGLGANVSIVSPADEDPLRTAGDNPFAKKRGSFKKRLISLVSRYSPQILFECLEMAYNRSAYAKIKRVVESKNIDLIYERYAFFMSAGARVAQEKKVPFIIEVNEIAGYERVRKQVFVKKAQAAEQMVFWQADAIIVVSEFLKDKISALGVESHKIHVIPNAADEVLFDPEQYNAPKTRARFGLKATDIVFGFIGWFVAWHKLEFFIRAFAQLDDPNAKLVLVGDGPLKETLRVLAKSLKIEQRVIFAGAVPYNEVSAMINAFDAGIIPDSNQYRSPIKMFEYMIMGKTVIAPDYEPVRSVIEDGEDGIIFSSNDREDLVSKLNSVLKDTPKRKTLGKKAREKILNKYLWRHNTEKVIQIYRKIAEK